MKYVHYEAQTGKILGWYDVEIHGRHLPEKRNTKGEVISEARIDISSIPRPNKEVTDMEWQSALDSGVTVINSDGSFEKKDLRTPNEKAIEEETTAWITYKKAKEAAEKQAWIDAGKPLYS